MHKQTRGWRFGNGAFVEGGWRRILSVRGRVPVHHRAFDRDPRRDVRDGASGAEAGLVPGDSFDWGVVAVESWEYYEGIALFLWFWGSDGEF